MADISKYRKTPLPTYWSASTGNNVSISYNFETWLLRLGGLQKRNLIQRLRESVNASRKRGARDNLMLLALENQAKDAGATVTELDVNLSEYSKFTGSLLEKSNGSPEVDLIVAGVALGYGETLFQRNMEENTLIATSFLKSKMQANAMSQDLKRQINSLIGVITQYITPEDS